MPCYDGRDNQRIEYINGVNPEPYNEKIIHLENKCKFLEAGLCAIITELEKKDVANEIISQASKSGLIDLMDFWNHHSKEDETRLALKLHQFSEHEQDVILRLLTKSKE